MGNRVLLSFVGTGSFKENGGNRDYRKAKYSFESGNLIVSSFIAEAIRKEYQIDKLILIGTTHSMWEEVYKVFSAAGSLDENYYVTLGEWCDNANSKTPLELPELDKLEGALGTNSKVLLVNYGVNEQQVSENQEIILGVEKYLDKQDELYLDITHAFRSLPLFLLNTIIYLQNVSPKRLTMKKIFYGMLEASNEFGYTPVVDLSSLLKTSEWIIGAYALREYAKSQIIANLIEGDKTLQSVLNDFSNLIGLNYFENLKNFTGINSLKNHTYLSPYAEILVKPIVDEYTSLFPQSLKLYQYQYRLAKWHFDHYNYLGSYMSLVESVVSFACSKLGYDEEGFDSREYAKSELRQILGADMYGGYKKINANRNKLAHITSSSGAQNNYARRTNVNTMISDLGKYLHEFKELLF